MVGKREDQTDGRKKGGIDDWVEKWRKIWTMRKREDQMDGWKKGGIDHWAENEGIDGQ